MPTAHGECAKSDLAVRAQAWHGPPLRFDHAPIMNASAPPIATPTVLITCLIGLSALATMSIQIFVPALPYILRDFDVSAGVGQLTITISLVVTGVATLFFGPISDRFGRKRVVLFTLGIFVVSSGACAAAPNVETLIGMRNLQALGASAGVVLARAIAVDAWGRDRSATVLAYLSMAMGLSTLLSPTVGGVLSDAWGWRAPFVFCLVLGVALSAASWNGIPSDEAKDVAPMSGHDLLRATRRLIASPNFLAYSLGSGVLVATFFGFTAVAPYLVVEVLGRTATDFGLWFMLMPGGFVTGSLISSRIGVRVGAARMCALGSSLSTVGAISFGVLFLTLPLSLPTIFIPAMVIGVGNGLALPNAQAGAMGVEPRLAGTASGLVGFMQSLFGAIASQIVAQFYDGTATIMAIVAAACAISGLACGLVSLSLAKSAKPAP